jgi:AP-4 complex subunit epsilon-1
MHLTQLLSAFPASIPTETNRLAERALEVSAVYDQNGGAYVKRLCDVCTRVNHQSGNKGKQNATNSGARLVSENVVEQVLLHLRRCTSISIDTLYLTNAFLRFGRFPKRVR